MAKKRPPTEQGRSPLDEDAAENPGDSEPGFESYAETPAEALARARTHARAAVGEALEALRALLDAAALAASGESAEMHRLLGPAAKLLEGLAADFTSGDGVRSAPVLDAVADALDAEIARWEERARSDAEARAVLRAFLGVRELLWELGVRRTAGTEPEPPRPPKARPDRVQRVTVEG